MELKLETHTPQRVLAIVAHPDDIEFGMAGSIARWIDAGATVVYCIVTDGAAGSNQPGIDLDELARTRVAEQRAAAAALGVSDVRFLGYHDGTLEPTIALRRDLTRVIREVRPDRVVTMDPSAMFGGDTYVNHPDHRAASEAALYATFPSAGSRPIFPELLAEGLEPHDVAELYLVLTDFPTIAVDITPTFDRKMAALLAHKSQLGEEIDGFIRGMAGETGALAGVTYAEAFRVIQLAEHTATSTKAPDAGA